jgi:hypothetical protein
MIKWPAFAVWYIVRVDSIGIAAAYVISKEQKHLRRAINQGV